MNRRKSEKGTRHYLYQYDYYLHDISQESLLHAVVLILFFTWFVLMAHRQIEVRRDSDWRWVCVLVMQTGLQGVYQGLFRLLTYRRVSLSFQGSCDLVILLSCGLMLSEDYSLERVQNCSVLIVVCLYIKILNGLSIMKQIGIYTIIIGEVIKRLAVFLLMLFSVLVVLGLCFNLLFKKVVSAQESIVWSIFTEVASPLGMVSLISL